MAVTEPSRLTDQERLCLVLLDELGSAQAVANRLGLALSTVYNHHQRAMRKLGASSAVRAAQLYLRQLNEQDRPTREPSELSSGDDSRLGSPSPDVSSSEGIATSSAEKQGAETVRENRAPFSGTWSLPSPERVFELRPWRGKGERDSRLTTTAKLGWIVGVACLTAIMVLMLVSVGVSLTLVHR